MKVIDKISQWMNYVAMGLVLALMLLTVSDVFMRFVFNNPITGTPEMAKFIMVSLVLGVAWCAVQNEHISIDMVMKHFSPGIQRITGIVTLLLGLVIGVIITYQAYREFLWELKFKYTASTVFLVPTAPFWLIYTFGCALLCVVIVTLIIKKIIGKTAA